MKLGCCCYFCQLCRLNHNENLIYLSNVAQINMIYYINVSVEMMWLLFFLYDIWHINLFLINSLKLFIFIYFY